MIPDDTLLGFGGGSDGTAAPDATIEYDEDGDNKIKVSGADWEYGDTVALTLKDATQSTTKDTGALVVEGGVGIEKNLNVGGNLTVGGASTFTGPIEVGPGNGGIVIDSIGNLASKKELDDAINEKSVADMSRAKALKGLSLIHI